MKTRWEKQNSKVILKIKCPCRNGYYIREHVQYEDDFCRKHYEYENHITCINCRDKYKYEQGWFSNSNYTLLKQKENESYKLCEKLRKEIYTDCMPNIKSMFNTKKDLYNFLNKNKIITLPTLNAFYKKGVDYYIGIESLNISTIEKILSCLNLLDNYKNRIQEIYDLEKSFEFYKSSLKEA